MLKSTGIVRAVDNLGRVVIPKELRRTFGIAEGDPLEIFVDGQNIIFRKYQPGCVLCGSMVNTQTVRGKLICGACAGEIAERRGA